MPIYEFECKRCMLRFEVKRRFGEDGNGFCPSCGNEGHRLFSPVPVIFKGPGFYVTDNRKNEEWASDKGKGGKFGSENEGE
ncbi:MAG: FmdB family zinc ribbon protein [Dehalococcoidia bacterium]